MTKQHTPINFVFWDKNGLTHNWVPKFPNVSALASASPLTNQGCWVMAPGYICGVEEQYRPVASETEGILLQLQNYYEGLTIPGALKDEQMRKWKAMDRATMKKQAMALFTKVAIQKRERALGKADEVIAREMGVQL